MIPGDVPEAWRCQCGVQAYHRAIDDNGEPVGRAKWCYRCWRGVHVVERSYPLPGHTCGGCEA